MAALWLLVRHELMLLRADALVRLTLAVFIVSTGVALTLGLMKAYREQNDFRRLTERVADDRLQLATEAGTGATAANDDAVSWGAQHPDFVANERGTYAVIPPAPLLALTTGQSDLYPTHFRITARLREAQVAGDALAHPLALLAGSFDVTFVALYFYPLMILAIGADLTATERESGLLRTVLAFPIRLTVVVAAKVLARAVVLLPLPLLVVAVFGASGLPANGVSRLLVWAAAVSVYGAFWLALAVLVGAQARSAAAATLTLAGCWVLLIVVVPSVFSLTLKTMYPVPSAVEFATRARAATRDAVVQGSRQLGSFLEDHPASGTGRAGMQQYALLQEIRDTEVAKRMAPVLAEHEAQLAVQRSAVARLQYVSPAIVLQVALTGLAGTGDARQVEVREQVARFQSAWKDYYQPYILAFTPLSAAAIGAAPPFRFQEERTSSVVRRVLPSLLMLIAATLAIGGWGWRSYRRYDVAG